MSYANNRTGTGRWCYLVRGANPGILWTNDLDSVGFQAIGKVASDDGIIDYDGAAVKATLDAYFALGKTATEAYELAANAMTAVNPTAGDLTTWRPAKMRARPDVSAAQDATSPKVIVEILKENETDAADT